MVLRYEDHFVTGPLAAFAVGLLVGMLLRFGFITVLWY